MEIWTSSLTVQWPNSSIKSKMTSVWQSSSQRTMWPWPNSLNRLKTISLSRSTFRKMTLLWQSSSKPSVMTSLQLSSWHSRMETWSSLSTYSKQWMTSQWLSIWRLLSQSSWSKKMFRTKRTTLVLISMLKASSKYQGQLRLKANLT